jgi:PAS domain-containing protein
VGFNKATFLKCDGTVGGLVGLMIDITNSKRTAKAIEESLSRFDAFMDNLPALAFIKDQSWKYIHLNLALESFYNQSVEQRLGKTDYELWLLEIAKKIVENDQKVLADGEVSRVQEMFKFQHNAQYQLTVKFPNIDENQQKLLAGVTLDISGWRAAKREKEVLDEYDISECFEVPKQQLQVGETTNRQMDL